MKIVQRATLKGMEIEYNKSLGDTCLKKGIDMWNKEIDRILKKYLSPGAAH